MLTIDKFSYLSKLRYINAAEKFSFAVITLILCVVSRSVCAAAITLFAAGFLTVYKGKIPLFRYLRYLAVPVVFLLFSTLAVFVNISRTPLDLFAVPVGSFYLTGSRAAAAEGIRLILTALAGVSCLYFLAFNTPMPDILNVLLKLHCPKLLIELMLLIYRFIFLLLDIAFALSCAQASRLGNKDFRTSCRSFGSLLAVLLVLAMKRSNALYDAMESRCYDGTIRVLNETYPPRAGEIAAIIGFELLLAAVWLLEVYML